MLPSTRKSNTSRRPVLPSESEIDSAYIDEISAEQYLKEKIVVWVQESVCDKVLEKIGCGEANKDEKLVVEMTRLVDEVENAYQGYLSGFMNNSDNNQQIEESKVLVYQEVSNILESLCIITNQSTQNKQVDMSSHDFITVAVLPQKISQQLKKLTMRLVQILQNNNIEFSRIGP